MININSKLPSTGATIFSVMTKLAEEHNAINLAQGFPDFPTDPKLINLVHQAMKDGFNQYAPMAGLAELRQEIAKKVKNLYGADYNAETEITVTAGGTEAIFSAISAIINPGDEVIIFEPAYDCYAPTIKLLGGLVKPYELAPPNYAIDWNMVKKLFSVNTKMIILNTPHNPTGCTLSDHDIAELTKLTDDTDIIILSDEVYEHMVYDGKKHQSMALYPKLRKRSFIVSSFGKLLHTTGWKMGYCLAPEQLSTEFRKVHQFNVFSANTPTQQAIAQYLKNPEYYLGLSTFFQEKRDYFRTLLAETKFKLLPCNGSYFQCVTYENISKEKDSDLAKRLITDFGVAAIPVSAFYTKAIDYRVLRFCFAKKTETLEKAVERLMKIK